MCITVMNLGVSVDLLRRLDKLIIHYIIWLSANYQGNYFMEKTFFYQMVQF